MNITDGVHGTGGRWNCQLANNLHRFTVLGESEGNDTNLTDKFQNNTLRKCESCNEFNPMF